MAGTIKFRMYCNKYTPVALSFTIWGSVPSVHIISTGREVFGRLYRRVKPSFSAYNGIWFCSIKEQVKFVFFFFLSIENSS